MSLRFARSICASALLTWIAAPCWAAPADGRLMALTVTTTMHVQGVSMPAQASNRKVCAPAGVFDPRQVVDHGMGSDCKVSDYQKVGSTITYHVDCTQPQPISSDGTFQQLDAGAFRGEMHTTTSAAGRAMTVLTSYAGQQAGSCAYSPPKR